MTSSLLAGSGVGDSLADTSHAQNHELDELWTSIRNFFDDLNAKGDKREFGRNDKPNKLKFMEACEFFDTTKSGIIKERDLMIAFSRSRYSPLPTEE